MAFRKKSYQEIVDDILTDLTGGVVGEEHTYLEDTDTYLLDRRPVRPSGIVSVRGTVNDAPYTFAGPDYRLKVKDEEALGLEWVGTRPDLDTTFYVSYYPADVYSPITDRNIGSVTRTIVEALSREVATLYAQLDKTYLSAFVDTAEGRSLEFVVSMLGMERILAGRAVGTVEFSRSTSALGDITIPLGTIVSDREDNRYETSEEATLRQGQLAVEVPIRAVSENVPPVAARTLTLMPRPVVGIEKVSNYEATTLGTKDESDEELRARAKAALYGAGKATVEAIRFAILEQGVNSVVIHDMPQGVAGELDVIVDYEGEKEKDIKEAIEETRAAGIRVNFNRTQRVDLTLTLEEVTLTTELLSDEQAALKRSIRRNIVDYVASLAAGEKVLGNQLVALAMADPRVQDVSIQPSGDIPVGRMEKANIEETDIAIEKFIVAPVEIAPEEVPEGPTPVQIEATIHVQLPEDEDFVSAIGDLAEAQARVKAIIEAKVQAYLAELFAGDEIVFTDFLNALASGKYTIDEERTQLRDTHTADGLVVTLDQPDDTDWVREGEKVELVAINVNFA